MGFLSFISKLFKKPAPAPSGVVAPVHPLHYVKASSFADPADVAAYRKWYKRYRAEGYEHERAQQLAFKKGDNGIGFTGLNCADPAIRYCALPREDWLERWGSKKEASGRPVIVTYNGKDYPGFLGDTMPGRANITNGCGIDLNPGFAQALGVHPPFIIQVAWRWA